MDVPDINKEAKSLKKNLCYNSDYENSVGFLNILNFNAQCLISQKQKTKISYLKELARNDKLSVLGLTETWLRESVKDEEVHMEDFNIFRSDRVSNTNKNFPHGGVLIYIRDNLTVHDVKTYSDGECDAISITIKSIECKISVIYRPPNATNNSFQNVLNFVQSYIETGEELFNNFIMGDFNLPPNILKWEKDENDGQLFPITIAKENEQSKIFINFMLDNFLTQMVDLPTRNENILDLILVNDSKLVNDISSTDTLLSDHKLVVMNTSIPLTNELNKLHQEPLPFFGGLNFSKVNWVELGNSIKNVNWTEVMDGKNVTDAYTLFLENLGQCCIETNVPKKKKKPKSNIPKDRKRLFRQQSDQKRKLKSKTNISEKEKSKILEKIHQTEKMISESMKQELLKDETKAVEMIRQNSRHFYNYANKKRKILSKIGPVILPDGKLSENDKEVANALNNQYVGSFSHPMEDKIVKDPQSFFNDPTIVMPFIDNVVFTTKDVEESLSSFKSGAAPGPDGIPTDLLKNCASELSIPLSIIFRMTLDEGNIPEGLKLAKITPVHKGGDKKLCKNYRPVALTSHIAKSFEKIIKKYLVSFLENNNLFNPNQHGFRNGRSTLSQLLQYYDDLICSLDDETNVDSIYLDFAKAFDKCDFGIIMHALKTYGIIGKMGIWIHSFLTNRSQFVCANGIASSEIKVVSGVPQGTVIAPVIFILLLTNIDSSLQIAKAVSFADDTKVSAKIRNANDANFLQLDLQSIYKWAENNNMEFNGSKFQLLRYGKNTNIRMQTSYVDCVGNQIQETSEAKDLGIIMSSNGSFYNHIQRLIQCTSQMNGWILRTFITRKCVPMLTLFKSLVISKLDYCSLLWNPNGNASLCNDVERVQRAFTKRIDGMSKLDYWTRLKELKLYSLQRRRERFAIIYMFKILHGLVPNLDIKFNYNERTGIRAIAKVVPNTLPTYIKTMQYNSFTQTGPKLFNCIPKELRKKWEKSDNMVETFKRKLDEFLSIVPDQPTIPGQQRAARSNSISDQIYYINCVNN